MGNLTTIIFKISENVFTFFISAVFSTFFRFLSCPVLQSSPVHDMMLVSFTNFSRYGVFMLTNHPIPRQRNYGIDLLRILSMLYVVILHSLYQGLPFDSLPRGSMTSIYLHMVEGLCFCAVNIFGIISGYVGYREEEGHLHHYRSLCLLWLQVVFYNVGITLLFMVLKPGCVSLPQLISCFFPVIRSSYWYFTAYAGLFLLMPFLDSAIRGSSSVSLRARIPVFFLLFSVCAVWNDSFHTRNGYSMVWLTLLYILGASLKKTGMGKELSIPVLIIGILYCTVVSAYLSYKQFYCTFLTLPVSSDALKSYLFPTHVINALCHVLLFQKLRIPQRLQIPVMAAALGTFSVYLINTHPLVWDYVLKGLFQYLLDASILRVVVDIPVFAVGFVMVALGIDWLRRQLFRLLQIPRLSERFVDSVRNFLHTTAEV